MNDKPGSLSPNDVWLIFIRTTIGIAWAVGSWAIYMLIQVDKNQAIVVAHLTVLSKKVDALELRNSLRDAEEILKLKKRLEQFE